MAASLTTPEVIRTFQRKLYTNTRVWKAKKEPEFRFYSLYDKIHREDILLHAYRHCRANGGASGVDGMTFEKIDATGREKWLKNLQEELQSKSYKPQPVRRVMIPKPGGGERPLGIPTIRDRVAQMAAKLILEPIFEADFEDSAYGYRPGRSAGDAVEKVHQELINGRTEVVDADLSKYFDTIPHEHTRVEELMKSVARRVADGAMLHLVKMWLKAPIEEKDENGNTRMTGGKANVRGTPQGGVLSPLLANIYMRRFLLFFRRSEMPEKFQARIVNYADDFVILCRRDATMVLERTRRAMERIGLTLNEAKTCVRNGQQEHFDFLGYTFGPIYFPKTGKRYTGARPSDKAEKRLREKVKGHLYRGNPTPWPELRDRINSLLRGWAGYFSYGSRAAVDRRTDLYVEDSVRDFLRKRHKLSGRGFRQFSRKIIFGKLGVLSLVEMRKRIACRV